LFASIKYPHQAVTANILVVTAIWVTTPTFGLLQRAVVTLHGADYWITVYQKLTVSTAIRETVFLFVVSGISGLCVYFTI